MLELIKSIFANASERIKSPLIGTFITSWTVFNWKAILVLLFSIDDIETKLTLLSEKYSHIGNLLWYPLFVTLLYIFALPYINLGIDWLLNHSSKERDKRIHNNKVDAIEESIVIANKKIELEDRYKTLNEKSKYNQQVDSLNNDIKILEVQLNEETNSSKMVINKLNEENAKLVKIITESNNQINDLQFQNRKFNNLFSNISEAGKVTKNYNKAIKDYLENTNNISNSIATTFKKLNTDSLNSVGYNVDIANTIKNSHDISNMVVGIPNERGNNTTNQLP